jgi:nucleotide-binding universal stress UspA family protein
MNTVRSASVVVGVDDSASSRQAVVYAAWEAERRGAKLRMVHGYLVPTPCLTPLAPLFDDDELRAAARDKLAETARVVRARRPRLPLETAAVRASGAEALIEESATASLVVLGSPHHGGFARSPIGSVASPVVAGARGPVLVVQRSEVVPAPIPGAGAVLVGVHGLDDSPAVLEFGFEEAAARDVPLVAVHVWSGTHVGIESGSRRQDFAERILAEAVASGHARHPQVRLRRLVVPGPAAARVLLDLAREVGAGLLVIGSRDRRGIIGSRCGSVGSVLLSHAEVPVAVIRPPGGLRTGIDLEPAGVARPVRRIQGQGPGNCAQHRTFGPGHGRSARAW